MYRSGNFISRTPRSPILEKKVLDIYEYFSYVNFLLRHIPSNYLFFSFVYKTCHVLHVLFLRSFQFQNLIEWDFSKVSIPFNSICLQVSVHNSDDIFQSTAWQNLPFSCWKANTIQLQRKEVVSMPPGCCSSNYSRSIHVLP